jgi:CheY-like chemotaxis protein
MVLPDAELNASLMEVEHSIEELARARTGVNDPDVNAQISDFLSAAHHIVRRQLKEIETTVADDLTSLLEGVRSIDVPAKIEEIGRTAGLTTLRSAQGLVVMSLVRAIEDAAKMGLHPRRDLVGALPNRANGSALSSALKGVVTRIAALEVSLDDLEAVQSREQASVQQSDLTAQTVGVLRVEARLVRFLLNAPNAQTTISAVIRTLSAMTERTSNFWATIVAWKSRVSTNLLQASDRLRLSMRRTLRGARTAISWHNRLALRALAQKESTPQSAKEDRADVASSSLAQSGHLSSLRRLRRYGQMLFGNLSTADGYLTQFVNELSQDPSVINYKDNVRWQKYKLYNELVERSDIPAFDYHPEDIPGLSDHQIALAGVDYRARQVFLLFGSEGLAIPEITKALGLTEDQIRLHLHEAASQLASVLATRVLIIEPHRPTAERIAAVAAEFGHKVLPVVGTEAEVNKVAQSDRPGLIIAEIQLRDGSSGLTAVNRVLETQQVPVIFVTGYPERFLTGPRPEPAFLIAKPFDDRWLAAMMARALFFKRVATNGNVRHART